VNESDDAPPEDGALGKHAGRRDGSAADQRDGSAELRDIAGARRDRASDDADDVATWRDRLSERRERAAAERETDPAMASERAIAKMDRDEGVVDRMNAARDRRAALADRRKAKADRDVSAQQRKVACIDALTGAYLYQPGILELQREMDRADRTERPLILSILDIDGYEAMNVSEDPAAGDRALQAVVQTVRASLRSYDRIIRLEDAAFLCVLWNVDLEIAVERFERVNIVLSKNPAVGAVSIGLTEFENGETVEIFIERTNAALLESRQSRQG
jgi:diguanylate cyclase (GGDEF)-like protein